MTDHDLHFASVNRPAGCTRLEVCTSSEVAPIYVTYINESKARSIVSNGKTHRLACTGFGYGQTVEDAVAMATQYYEEELAKCDGK